MEEFCSRQGLGPEVDSRRGRATRQAFLAADHLAMAALLAATDATTGIPDEQLAACQVPALWIAGTEDHPRFEQSQRAARLMPKGRFVPLPGRVHGSTLSPPDEDLQQVLPFRRRWPRKPAQDAGRAPLPVSRLADARRTRTCQRVTGSSAPQVSR